jgi:hypothetical protein
MMPAPAPAGPVVAITPVVLAPPIPPWGAFRQLACRGHWVLMPLGSLLAPRPFRCGGTRCIPQSNGSPGTRSPRHPLGLTQFSGPHIFGSGLCAQQGASLAGESPAAPSQGGCVDKRPGQDPAAVPPPGGGGQGVHCEVESEGPASNLRAVAEARARANRSAMTALIRAGSLTAKEIPAERGPRHGVCGQHGGTEERLTWGGLVVSPMVFMPAGPKSRRGKARYKAQPKCRADAPRAVRTPIVVRTCRENGTERRGVPERERPRAVALSTVLEAR